MNIPKSQRPPDSPEIAEAKRLGFKPLTFGYKLPLEQDMLDRAIRQLGGREHKIIPNNHGLPCIWTRPSRARDIQQKPLDQSLPRADA